MTDDTPRRLRWGQSLARDASRAGCENTIPVFDGDTHIGDVELSDDDTRVLTAMLADLVVSLAPAYRNPVKRVRFDLLDDDKLDHLYDRLEVAEQFLAAFVVRGNPETWQRQADEIGRLLGRLDDHETLVARLHQIHNPEPLNGGYNPNSHACGGCEPEQDSWHADYPCPTITVVHEALNRGCVDATHHFDSKRCPEPCSKWHTRCDNCGQPYDECPNNNTPEQK